jgi:hypothetical protein
MEARPLTPSNPAPASASRGIDRRRPSRPPAALALGLALLCASLAAPRASAQERGQYLPGFRGLNSGVTLPPGWTYANYLFWYPTDSLRDRDGDEVAIDFDLDVIADLNLIVYTSKRKILGGTYSANVAVPIQNTAVSLARLDAGAAGFGDLFVTPFSLGWTGKRLDTIACYAFMAPTGKFDEEGSDTVTTDYWGHHFNLAMTGYLSADKLTQVSFAANLELHQTKRHSDVKIGNNLTLEYALGKAFVRDGGRLLLQPGVTGYAELQLSDDSGDDAIGVGLGKDRVFGLGGELNVIWPQSRWNAMARIIPEFGAQLRTSGTTLAFVVGKGF